ncbi:MAG: hypothetical protein WD600_05690 [Pseudohongiella sp.]
MLTMMIISVLGWVGFLVFFRSFWPGGTEPGTSLYFFWLWLLAGGTGFVGVMLATFRLFSIPPAWRVHAAVALVGPATLQDVLATVFIDTWLVSAGSVDDRLYPAMILGGVGMILLVGLFMTDPDPQSTP